MISDVSQSGSHDGTRIHPCPQWSRDTWTLLDGLWAFTFDDQNVGRRQRWFSVGVGSDDDPFDLEIQVPFAHQWPASGLEGRERHDVVWYRRRFSDPRAGVHDRLLLHFGAVDVRASVWVNGSHVGAHEGGHTSFVIDITDAVSRGDNTVVVRAEDVLTDLDVPRGKQFWESDDASVFYRPTTGIWQSVWLEPVCSARFLHATFRPDLDAGRVEVSLMLTPEAVGSVAGVRISVEGRSVVDDRIRVTDGRIVRVFSLLEDAAAAGSHVADHHGLSVWSPDSPALYDVELTLSPQDDVVDRVSSYFGVRKVEARDGRVWLNGSPYPLRLVLDQGYFPGGGLTGTEDQFRRDIELTKEMGFNGVRKHQKVEDPRWLHLADTMGLLVWEEMPSAYRYSDDSVVRVSREWAEVVTRDRNHPCIIAWVPFNESWGVPRVATDRAQRAFVEAMVGLTRALDPTRLVVSNDGWEQTTADLFTVHDYRSPEVLEATYADADIASTGAPGGHVLTVPGHEYAGQPLVLSEFGGVSLSRDENDWGYSLARDGDDLADRVRAFLVAAGEASALAGYCYTQLTDVGRETNGLLTFDRVPKVPLDVIADAVSDQRP